MFAIVHYVHDNIVPQIANPCCLFWCDFQPWLPHMWALTHAQCKPVPQPTATPAPKPAPKGKHIQLFKMRRRVGKGFYSTAPDAPDSE